MSRNKLKKILSVGELENVFTDPADVELEGRVVLELGCGHGEYASSLGRHYPDVNFVGVDRKGERVWWAAKKAQDAGLKNVFFIKGEVSDLVEFFGRRKVDEIWITFPDPFPKPCRAKKRLVSSKFLEVYRRILKPGGIVHFKTDLDKLFDYGLEVLGDEGIEVDEIIRDVHGQEEVPELLQIKTYYEQKFMAKGHPIFYLRYRLG